MSVRRIPDLPLRTGRRLPGPRRRLAELAERTPRRASSRSDLAQRRKQRPDLGYDEAELRVAANVFGDDAVWLEGTLCSQPARIGRYPSRPLKRKPRVSKAFVRWAVLGSNQ